jgi:hypothetical protein
LVEFLVAQNKGINLSLEDIKEKNEEEKKIFIRIDEIRKEMR